jgi:hypothetical protein
MHQLTQEIKQNINQIIPHIHSIDRGVIQAKRVIGVLK